MKDKIKQIKETLGLLHSMVLSGERTDGTATKSFNEALENMNNISSQLEPPVSGLTALRLANEIREKEWDPNSAITLAYRGNELAGEVGEACNIIKKIERERIGIRGTRASLKELAEELADVIICADLVAMHEGINLEEAVINKFNNTSEKYNLETRMPANEWAIKRKQELSISLKEIKK